MLLILCFITHETWTSSTDISLSAFFLGNRSKSYILKVKLSTKYNDYSETLIGNVTHLSLFSGGTCGRAAVFTYYYEK